MHYIIIASYTDIDECAESTNGCSQTCNNTIGSYMCSCDFGYRLASNGRVCNGRFTKVSVDYNCGGQ